MFLPESYKAPKSGDNYAKIQEGENKFRILSAPVFGWEDWLDKKPVRYRMDEKPSKPLDPTKPIKHFWAMMVWNYIDEKVQVLQITQATIRASLEHLCKDPEWGMPYFYDIKIIKKGEGKNTEYVVNPVPPKQLNPEVIAHYKDKPCNLDALFSNADPFANGYDSYTQGIFSEADLKPVVEVDVEGYLKTFGKGKELMRQFLDKVCATRHWTPEQAVTEFRKDANETMRKFEDWKQAQKMTA